MTTDAVKILDAVLAVRRPEVEPDAHLNSYETGLTQGVYDHGAMLSVVGANGRRLLIRDDADGVYVGGVLITEPVVLAAVAGLLGRMTDRIPAPREGD